MDDLVRTLLEDLSRDLDRLADRLEPERPGLARTLRVEGTRLAPLRAEDAPPPRRQPRERHRPLRTALYTALDEGAMDHRRFDRLMLLHRRALRR